MDMPLTHDDPMEDIGRNDSANWTFGEVVARRLSRRAALGGLAATALAGTLSPLAARPAAA
ncbi:MAG TPA: hypothetical protein VJ890_19115, partial [Vineibacter sp.]|nr:hypothetical protein [Vineibacter sp.]